MTDEFETEVVHMAPNAMIAEVLVGFLKDAGIPAFVEGSNLQDEFAATQRALGNLAVRIRVPKEDAARAKELIEHHQQSE